MKKFLTEKEKLVEKRDKLIERLFIQYTAKYPEVPNNRIYRIISPVAGIGEKAVREVLIRRGILVPNSSKKEESTQEIVTEIQKNHKLPNVFEV